MSTITITKQFCGPPDSGNGGYTCGMLARHIDGPAEVTLLLPPPLEEDMEVRHEPEGGVVLLWGEKPVARAVPAVVDLEVPQPPSFEAAQKGFVDHAWMKDHIFPTCFVCGPARSPGDGLRIFSGLVEGQEYVAAPWIPDPCFRDENGYVREEIIWACLDCPGAWAAIVDKLKVIVLGRLAVKIMDQVKVGEHCVILGWITSEEGRKTLVGTALFGEDGRLCANARATWIELRTK
ncbi:MAG: hypothetical protein ACM3MK_07900 [Chitinophagales bacterium]